MDGIGENSPQEYDKIYFKRKEKGIDASDFKRWKKLLKYYRGGKLLDVGCLDSLVPQIAREWYPKAEVWGIDVAEKAIKDMQERFPGVVYQVENAYETSFPSNYFDYIVAGEILEHIDDPKKFVDEAFRILKHGGILAISTPKEEVNEPGAVDAHRHVWSWSPLELELLLGHKGDFWLREMGSQYFPQYVYRWPTLLAFTKKK